MPTLRVATRSVCIFPITTPRATKGSSNSCVRLGRKSAVRRSRTARNWRRCLVWHTCTSRWRAKGRLATRYAQTASGVSAREAIGKHCILPGNRKTGTSGHRNELFNQRRSRKLSGTRKRQMSPNTRPPAAVAATESPSAR